MFLLILAAIVSGDVVRINTVNTGKSITLLMGGAPQTFDVDAYKRMTWMDNPSTNEITLVIGDDSYDLKTSRTGAGWNGCNYNFDIYSDTQMYQNSGMECTKVFEKAPGAIELLNDVGKKVYPAFDIGWGFSSDSVMGWLGADQIAVYTSENPYLAAIGAKDGTEVEVGYFDQSNYQSCGTVKVGDEFIKKLSDCTGTEKAVGASCKVATGWDKKHNCGGSYWELSQWGCCSQVCCPKDAESAVGGTKAGACSAADIAAGCVSFETTSAFCYCKTPGISGKSESAVGAGCVKNPTDCSQLTAGGESCCRTQSSSCYWDKGCHATIDHFGFVGTEKAVGASCKVATGWDKKHDCGGSYWELSQWGCCSQVCCPRGEETNVGSREIWEEENPFIWAETNVGGVAGGLSHPHQTGTGKYSDYFSDGGKCNGDGMYSWTGKMSYQSCDLTCLKKHCQSLGRKTSYGDWTMRKGKIFACCTTGGEEVVAVAMQTSISTEDWAVYGFAVIGIGALAHVAYKKVTQKSRAPIYQEV